MVTGSGLEDKKYCSATGQTLAVELPASLNEAPIIIIIIIRYGLP